MTPKELFEMARWIFGDLNEWFPEFHKDFWTYGLDLAELRLVKRVALAVELWELTDAS
jgi:hypothetical protein